MLTTIRRLVHRLLGRPVLRKGTHLTFTRDSQKGYREDVNGVPSGRPRNHYWSRLILADHGRWGWVFSCVDDQNTPYVDDDMQLTLAYVEPGGKKWAYVAILLRDVPLPA